MESTSFVVNGNTCVRCGQCIEDCLFKLIEMGDIPFMPEENRLRCIHCGHCQAICPTASITLDDHDPRKLEKVRPPLEEAALQNLIWRRRSVRHYHQEKFDRDLLEHIIKIISLAPTGSNNRGVAYIVYDGRDKVEELLRATVDVMKRHDLYPAVVRKVMDGDDQIFRGAPCLLITHAPAQLLASVDCATALATLELALPTFGLASCWAGIFTRVCDKELPAGLVMPEGNKLYGAVMIGKPAVHYKRVPFRQFPSIEWK